jgi:hypothetical protein
MALVGYEVEKGKIEERIKQIRAQIGAGGGARKAYSSAELNVPAEDGKPKRRKFSRAARKRMAAAQRKRWAEKRAETSAT